MAAVNENEFLVIGGDVGYGPKAQYKKIVTTNVSHPSAMDWPSVWKGK
jgi:hypothetical protein